MALALALAATVAASQHLLASSDVQVLRSDTLEGFVGAVWRCCKTTGGEDCQQCRTNAKNMSFRYNMGPVANTCVGWDDVKLTCDMSGTVICGTAAGGGMRLFWDLNEDCLGVVSRQFAMDYSIKTAAGDWCPEE
jgi:hypothetical protein